MSFSFLGRFFAAKKQSAQVAKQRTWTRENGCVPSCTNLAAATPSLLELTMDDLTTFLNSVESTARKILKQQNKKQQQQAARDRVALVKKSIQSGPETNGTSHTPTREELRVTYASGGSLVITAPVSPAVNNQKLLDSPSRSEHSSDDGTLPRLPPPRSPVASVLLGVSTLRYNCQRSAGRGNM